MTAHAIAHADADTSLGRTADLIMLITLGAFSATALAIGQ